MGKDRLLSSMFHRRLVLLLVAGLTPIALIVLQLARLTIIEGDEYRADAEGKLVVREWAPTTRGRILGAKGRILAQDRPSFDIAMDYAVISGEWAESRAGEAARRAHEALWDELGPNRRSALIDLYLPVYREHVDRAWARLANEAGVIRGDLDRRAESTETRVENMVEYLHEVRRESRLSALKARGREITAEIEDRIDESLASQRIAEQESAHTIVRGIDDELAFHLMRLADKTVMLSIPAIAGAPGWQEEAPLLPGLVIEDRHAREYPFATMIVDVDASTLPPPLARDEIMHMPVEGVATHILGWMGRGALEEDVQRRRVRREQDPAFADRVTTPKGVDRGEYRAADTLGRSGVEWSREARLRGLRGLRVTHLETGHEDVLAPVAGGDVHLTIDIMLQARIQAIMHPALGLAQVQPWHNNDNMKPGTPLYGAAVVMEIDTGRILAMVSTPSFTREQLANNPESIFDRPASAPWVNKAVQKPYPPGSIAKAVTLVEAVTKGLATVEERIPCTGHFLPGRDDILRCWIYRDRYGMATHSGVLGRDPNAVDALMVSCNIYSYTLGGRLGPDGMIDAYRDFGVGRESDLGIGMVYDGVVGDSLTRTDAVMMGMGQGPVAWTPLHAANAFATLARGGVWLEPTIIDGGGAPSVRDLGLNTEAIGAALRGLYKVVNDARHGTAYDVAYAEGRARIFNVPGVDVWGKTGTAQAPPIMDDPKGPDPATAHTVRKGDHGWFVALVAPEGKRPRYAISVIMEYAGSGGRVSGPIANQIVHALADEGYLQP